MTRLVCSSVAAPGGGAETIASWIACEDRRAAAGEGRNLVVRELRGRVVAKATRAGNADAGVAFDLVLRAGPRVRFRGTYVLEAGDLAMHLVGTIASSPPDRTLHPVDVTLACVDLST